MKTKRVARQRKATEPIRSLDEVEAKSHEVELKEIGKKEIMSPEDVLAAARMAPRVFNMPAYYHPVLVMRDKGHSWRSIAEWLKMFNIEMSHVHLRRLFIRERIRLSKLSAKELREEGVPEDILKEILDSGDPVKRLPAADPEDEDNDEGEEGP